MEEKPDEKPFDIGLVILRISPTKYSLGILDDSQICDVVNIKNLDFGDYIARLASDDVDFSEQASVIQIENDVNILSVLDEYSLYELIRIEGEDSDSTERKILEQKELKQQILKEIDIQTRIRDLKSLALELGKNRLRKETITPLIQEILYAHFSKTEGLKRSALNRSEILSQRLVDILTHLALIYEIRD